MSIGEIIGDVSVYIQRLKAHHGVRTDEELARILGMSKQNIANWRRRGAVPEKVRRRLFKESGVFEPAYFENFQSVAESAVVHSVALFSARTWLAELERDPTLEEWLLLGEALDFATAAIRHRLAALPRPLEPGKLFQQLTAMEEGRGAAYRPIAYTMATGSIRDLVLP